MLGTYIFAIVISSYWIDSVIIMQCPSVLLSIVFVSKSTLYDINTTTPAICLHFRETVLSYSPREVIFLFQERK